MLGDTRGYVPPALCLVPPALLSYVPPASTLGSRHRITALIYFRSPFNLFHGDSFSFPPLHSYILFLLFLFPYLPLSIPTRAVIFLDF